MTALYRNLGGTEETQFQLGDGGPSILAVGDALGIAGGALLVPSMDTTQRDALSPANGMIIYNSSSDQFEKYENSVWSSFAAGGGGGGGITSLIQDTTPELGGNLDARGLVVLNPIIRDYAVSSGLAGFSAGTLTLDYSLGPDFQFQLSANVTTISVTNSPLSGQLGKISLRLTQPVAGAFSVVLTGIDFGDVGSPVMPVGTGAVMELVIWTRDAGSTLSGATTFVNTGT